MRRLPPVRMQWYCLAWNPFPGSRYAVPLTRAECDRGIEYWFATKWPRDFHLAFYRDMTAANPHGKFDDVWWSRFLPVLRAWRATRPRGSDYLTQRAQKRFPALAQAWTTAVAPDLGADFTGVEWRRVAAFPTVVAEIKDVTSPVFTSKFCHFLAPAIFPIVDNAAMGNPHLTYADCSAAYQSEWRTTEERTRQELVLRLRELIGEPLDDGFPMKSKVVELCLIGRNHG